MSARTINSKGEIKVTPTDVSTVETYQIESHDIAGQILHELQRIRMQLELITGADGLEKED